MTYEQHLREASLDVARCAIITLSDTRTVATDTSGRRMREILTDAGHSVADYRIIPDEPDALNRSLTELLERQDIDAIFTNGGTGISRRDRTIEVIEKRLDQTLPGFGELFRMLSFEQIGSGAMLSRAVGGIARGKIVFAMPGSTKAVELALSKLVLPELKHLLHELRK